MKTLSRYLETQKNKLDSMQKRQAKLNDQQILEQGRLHQLTSHIDALPVSDLTAGITKS